MSSPVLDGMRASTPQRKILRCRAVLRCDGDIQLAARTIDISTTVLSLLATHSVAVGAECTVVFQMPAHGKLHDIAAAVQVLYNTCQGTDGFRLGLRFRTADAVRSRLIDSLH